MLDADQKIRKELDETTMDSPDTAVRRAVWRPVEKLDQAHLDRVCQFIRTQGVPSIHQVGLKGNKAVFFAFIHSPEPDSIYIYTETLRRSVEKGESLPIWWAYVIDGAMVNTTKCTMFGTTGYVIEPSRDYMFTVVDQRTIDLLRESVGLRPLNRPGP